MVMDAKIPRLGVQLTGGAPSHHDSCVYRREVVLALQLQVLVKDPQQPNCVIRERYSLVNY